MRLTKYIVQLLLVIIFTSVNAQTQQGVVKTRGRMVNGVLQGIMETGT